MYFRGKILAQVEDVGYNNVNEIINELMSRIPATIPSKMCIRDRWGTAVSVMAMVFGNMGDTSATGVCFSRDAGNGENLFNGEYLINAQGEDVVAGIRTPQPVSYTHLQLT